MATRGKAAGVATKPKQKPKDESAAAAVGLAPAKKRGRPPKEAAGSIPGHNKGPAELTDNQMQALLHQHVGKISKQKDAVATKVSELRGLYKVAKAEGFTKKDIDFAISMQADDAEEKTRAEMERQFKIARWMGTPLGAQPDLFQSLTDVPEVDKARAAGKVEGAAGRAKNNPYGIGIPQHKAWYEGYEEGQDANVEMIANMKKPASVDDAEFGGRRPN